MKINIGSDEFTGDNALILASVGENLTSTNGSNISVNVVSEAPSRYKSSDGKFTYTISNDILIGINRYKNLTIECEIIADKATYELHKSNDLKKFKFTKREITTSM